MRDGSACPSRMRLLAVWALRFPSPRRVCLAARSVCTRGCRTRTPSRSTRAAECNDRRQMASAAAGVTARERSSIRSRMGHGSPSIVFSRRSQRLHSWPSPMALHESGRVRRPFSNRERGGGRDGSSSAHRIVIWTAFEWRSSSRRPRSPFAVSAFVALANGAPRERPMATTVVQTRAQRQRRWLWTEATFFAMVMFYFVVCCVVFFCCFCAPHPQKCGGCGLRSVVGSLEW